MDYFSLCGIGLGLAMDAFAVCITNGAITRRVTFWFAIKLALCFALFQSVMPLLGWLIGKAGESIISAVDHWIALILLSYLGIGMIREARRKKNCGIRDRRQDGIKLKTLIALAVATSIDALATGIILPSAVGASTVFLMGLSVSVIGAITFVVCLIGVYIGKRFGSFCSCRAETFGGLVLIGIGVKIFIDHMFF
ncbi:manganese efflux pump [Caproiciproducens sp. NJN-50]|uniref:manganese efflux pump MntP n=1 Tax=Acutalibacteraceae TaxID=3082771 RepID=UPI000FFE135F|nr:MULTISPECIES: manganese efflux pump MntP family protein [Acutalibacteraceae]QAT49398.1 manganese efflux pump [Caproiciproducens sp. NJN-50]